jgi:PPOX class probable F420-dependent enzyme
LIDGMDIADALGFAATTNDGVLSTQKRDGRPQLSNITFDIGADGLIRISITATRAKYTNLTRDPRASLHMTGPDFRHWVVIEGDAVVLPVAAEASDATVEQLVDLYRAVAGEHPDWQDYRSAMVREQRTVVVITPTHAYGALHR